VAGKDEVCSFYENVPFFIYKGGVARITSSRLVGYEPYLHPCVSTIRS